MKLKKDFIVHNTPKECLLVPAGSAKFSGLVRGNATFGAILALLGEETDEDAVVSAMAERYDAPRGQIAADVRRTLERLREIGALDE